MAKHRKTREQKKLADLRHNFTHSLVTDTPVELKLKLNNKAIKPVKSIQTTSSTSTNDYPYLVKDLSKTGLLTVGILAFQIILFILIKNHTLAIPGLSY